MSKPSYVRSNGKSLLLIAKTGLKVDEWCQKNNVSRHAYYYWLRKIRKKACESLLPAIAKQEAQLAFTKVEMQVQHTPSMAPIIVHLQSAKLALHWVYLCSDVGQVFPHC